MLDHAVSAGHPDDEVLWAFATGTLDPARSSELEQHLETCTQCGARLDTLSLNADPLVARLRGKSDDSTLVAEDSATDSVDGRPEAADSLATLSQGPEPGPRRFSVVATGADGNTGRFTILHAHAKGGLGQVSLAIDQELNREVALKEIQPHLAYDVGNRTRFVLEAEVTGGLEHPGIVPVYGLGQYADGRPYYAMRFIKGDSLKEAAAQFHSAIRDPQSAFSSLEFRKLVGRFLDVCNAIEYAHSRGVLHRDLKPGNIMLGKYGETLVVDWGLAKVVGRSETDQPAGERTLQPTKGSGLAPTMQGTAMGTPAYTSPEQATGRLDELGPATDVYSLGATLYAVLTNHAPFEGGDIKGLLDRVARGEFPRPRERNPAIPAALEAICLKAMSVKPLDRYRSARELADEVERWLADEPVTAQVEPFAIRARRWLRKHPKSVTALSATLLVGLVSTAAIAAVTSHKNQLLAAANAEANRKRIDAETAREAEQVAKLDAQTKQTEAEAARAEEAQARRRAISVTNYLVDAFRRPDPEQDGRQITMAEALHRGVEDLKDRFEGDPHTKGVLLMAIGQSYIGLGLYQEAVTLFEQARDLLLTTLGRKHVDALQAMSNLARAYQYAGKVDQALQLYDETLDLMQSTLGPEHPDTVTTLTKLGEANLYAKEFEKALPYYERALQITRTRFGAEHPETLSAMNDLAEAYRIAKKSELAISLGQETLQLHQAILGTEHVDTLKSMGILADAYVTARKLDLALPLYEAALKLSRVSPGVSQSSTFLLLNNLAHTYRSTGRHDLAAPLLKEVLDAMRVKMGPDHPDTLLIMANLAFSYKSTGKPALAFSLLEEVLSHQRMKLGADHPQTLATMNDLASEYMAAGDLDHALPLLAETLKMETGKLGADHPQTLMSMNNLAVAYMHGGKVNLALPLLEETLKVRRGALPPDHPETLASIRNLASAHLLTRQFDAALPLFEEFVVGQRRRLGANELAFAGLLAIVSRDLAINEQFAPAEAYLRECLAIRQLKLPDDWVLFNTKSMLGAALIAQKKLAEAESLLIDGYVGMKVREEKIPEAVRARVTEALQRLVAFYTTWEKPDEAAKWQHELELRKATVDKPD